MSDAQTILKLIEAVDPSDTVKLDDIDARIWCFLNHEKFEKAFRSRALEGDLCIEFFHPQRGHGNGFTTIRHFYTRSRDELKAIRPNGWTVFVSQSAPGCLWTAHYWREDDSLYTPLLRTEELAELHAIIQTIDRERLNAHLLELATN